MVSSGAITIALIPSESRETKLEMTRMDGVRVERAGELKQRWRWRQRVRQKSKRFRLTKQQLGTCITLFCTFLSSRCTTTTWKCLISRFVEDGNTGQQLSFSFLELWHSPSELNCQKIANICTNWTRWNKRDQVWGSTNSRFRSITVVVAWAP